MIISLIAAIDDKDGIGKANRLPWHLQSDLKRFKKITMGHHILMGRKTYETIGKSLPGRTSIILTRQENYEIPDCRVVHSLEAGIRLAELDGESELFIIGGGEVFTHAINRADKIYLTKVHTNSYADVIFPRFNPNVWDLIVEELNVKDDHDDYASDFMVYELKH